LDAEHFCQELMGEWQRGSIHPILCAQYPPATASLNGVECITRYDLKRLSEQRFRVTKQQVRQFRISAGRLTQALDGNA
jgi:hypothetical protein